MPHDEPPSSRLSPSLKASRRPEEVELTEYCPEDGPLPLILLGPRTRPEHEMVTALCQPTEEPLPF